MLAIKERTLLEPPALENGDRLRSQEFLRRYEAMPELKKACIRGQPILIKKIKIGKAIAAIMSTVSIETAARP